MKLRVLFRVIIVPFGEERICVQVFDCDVIYDDTEIDTFKIYKSSLNVTDGRDKFVLFCSRDGDLLRMFSVQAQDIVPFSLAAQ